MGEKKHKTDDAVGDESAFGKPRRSDRNAVANVTTSMEDIIQSIATPARIKAGQDYTRFHIRPAVVVVPNGILKQNKEGPAAARGWVKQEAAAEILVAARSRGQAADLGGKRDQRLMAHRGSSSDPRDRSIGPRGLMRDPSDLTSDLTDRSIDMASRLIDTSGQTRNLTGR